MGSRLGAPGTGLRALCGRRDIFVRSERAGQRVMGSVRRFLEAALAASSERGEEFGNLPGRCPLSGISIWNLRARRGRSAPLGPDGGAPQRPDSGVYTPNLGTIAPHCDGGTESLSGRLDGILPSLHHGRRNRYSAGTTPILVGVCGRSSFTRRSDRGFFTGTFWREAFPQQAAGAAFSRRGMWHRSNRPGMTQAYSNTWFERYLAPLEERWARWNPPTTISGQLCLVF